VNFAEKQVSRAGGFGADDEIGRRPDTRRAGRIAASDRDNAKVAACIQAGPRSAHEVSKPRHLRCPLNVRSPLIGGLAGAVVVVEIDHRDGDGAASARRGVNPAGPASAAAISANVDSFTMGVSVARELRGDGRLTGSRAISD